MKNDRDDETTPGEHISRRSFLKAATAAGAVTAAGGNVTSVLAAGSTAERPAKAERHFLKSMNCSQAICETYLPALGVSAAAARKMSTGLAGGMGMGSECGALTGAICVVGMRFGPATGDTMPKVAQLVAEFRARHGQTTCSKLLGVDMGSAEGVKTASTRGDFTTKCPLFVRNAGEILERLLA